VDVVGMLDQTPTLLWRLYEGIPEGPHDPTSNKTEKLHRKLAKPH
jgi:hypothetical protein